nr:hypothetical protein [Tanacetum cinerariifolium]
MHYLIISDRPGFATHALGFVDEAIYFDSQALAFAGIALAMALSPRVLKSEGVRVYRAVQHSGELIVTFQGHTMQGSFVDLTMQRLSMWHQLIGYNTGKARVGMELKRIQQLQTGFQFPKMEEDFDATNEKEYVLCFYDLHMSAATCKCSSDRFTCLKHANVLCFCEPDQGYVYLRYTFDELNILIDSLKGKLVSLHKCVPRIRVKDNDGHTYTIKEVVHQKKEPHLGKWYHNALFELLNIGSVAFGKLWSYIVKIHDAGLIGPIFKVFLEEYPSESFMDVSADKCWELVLQRLNQQIVNGCKLDLEPIKCLSRLEMCRLSNPALAIEDLDPEHRCLEYWSNKVDHNEAMKLTFSMFCF